MHRKVDWLDQELTRRKYGFHRHPNLGFLILDKNSYSEVVNTITRGKDFLPPLYHKSYCDINAECILLSSAGAMRDIRLCTMKLNHLNIAKMVKTSNSIFWRCHTQSLHTKRTRLQYHFYCLDFESKEGLSQHNWHYYHLENVKLLKIKHLFFAVFFCY